MYTIRYVKLHPHAIEPTKAHWDDAGFDLYAVESILLKAHTFSRIPTGIAIQLPDRTEAQVRPRSGLAAKHGVTVLNSPGTVDAGYRGEVQVILINHGEEDFQIEPGMKIAQMVIKPIYDAEFVLAAELDRSDRGAGGFGSTGTR